MSNQKTGNLHLNHAAKGPDALPTQLAEEGLAAEASRLGGTPTPRQLASVTTETRAKTGRWNERRGHAPDVPKPKTPMKRAGGGQNP